MYLPAHFAFSDLAAVHAFMNTHVFALIAGQIEGRIEFAYAPIVPDTEPLPFGCARFHLARANPLAAIQDGAQLKLSLLGPHAYVSPDWYAAPDLVPTWNYVAVEGIGPVRRLKESELRRLLSDLTAREERALFPKPPWTMGKVAPERLSTLLTSIVGFELAFDTLEGKAKLSQNRSTADADGAIRGLESRGDPQSIAVAALMRETLARKRQ